MLGVIGTIATSQRQIKAEHIVFERAKWRDKLREALLEAHAVDTAAASRRLWLILSVNSNPFDTDDIALVDLAAKIERPSMQTGDFDELTMRIALLLKHDWDRAKADVQVWGKGRKRVGYERLMALKARSGRPTGSWSGQRPFWESD